MNKLYECDRVTCKDTQIVIQSIKIYKIDDIACMVHARNSATVCAVLIAE